MPAQKTLIIYPNTVPGRFIRRLNRFTAEVMIDGRIEIVHVKHTGNPYILSSILRSALR